MSVAVLHQLVHGYAHGHSLLAGSVELDRRDADLVARLSDLSGSLGPDVTVTPYLSLYPLPSERFFAVARTWLDPDAARAGCVLTHTVLVPMTLWMQDEYPIRFTADSHIPHRYALDRYMNPVPPAAMEREPIRHSTDPLQDAFVRRFFGEGLFPLVWFGATDPETVAWRVIRVLWPTLRRRFSCCTFSLQPRTLDDRPFDLLFAPTAVFSRFADYPREHVLDQRALIDKSPEKESWLRAWGDCIFGGGAPLLDEIRSLSSNLESYPTAIRRIFLYFELTQRAAQSPTSALGALDLLSTLAPDPWDSESKKRSLAALALAGVASAASEESIELLYLFSQRMQEPSLSGLNGDFDRELRSLLRNRIEAMPAIGLAEATKLVLRHAADAPASFLRGVGDGVIAAITGGYDGTTLLIEHPALGEQMIGAHPDVARAMLRTATLARREQVVGVLANWSQRHQASETRRALRRGLLPGIQEDHDATLLEELLRDLESDEVGFVCDLVANSDALTRERLTKTAAGYLGERHAMQVRQWALVRDWKTYQAAVLVSGSYAPNEEAMDELARSSPSKLHQALLLAAFWERITAYSIPGWLSARLARDKDCWDTLLPFVHIPELLAVLSRLARALTRSAVAQVPHAQSMLAAAAAGTRFSDLQEHAVRQVVVDWLEDLCRSDTLRDWFSEQWVRNWFRAATLGPLRRPLVEQLTASTSGWLRSWELLDALPEPVVLDNPSLVHEIVSLLVQYRPASWPREATQFWQRILVRTNNGGDDQLDLSSQALRFALDNKHLPLAAIVGETFYHVHEAALRDTNAPRRWSSWGFLQWDKALELRRGLIDAFRHSDWEPAWFVVAAREPWLLRKLCRRMMRQWGGLEFLERAYSGVTKLGTVNPQLTSALADILRSRDYSEDWD